MTDAQQQDATQAEGATDGIVSTDVDLLVEGDTEGEFVNVSQIARSTMKVDLVRGLMSEVSRLPGWTDLTEDQQEFCWTRLEQFVTSAIRTVVNIIATSARASVPCTLESISVKEKVKLSLTMSKHDHYMHEVMDAVGEGVRMVLMAESFCEGSAIQNKGEPQDTTGDLFAGEADGPASDTEDEDAESAQESAAESAAVDPASAATDEDDPEPATTFADAAIAKAGEDSKRAARPTPAAKKAAAKRKR